MKFAATLTLLVLATATLLPVEADAQLRRLRQRIQDRAEDRVEQRAEDELNRQVDKAVDKAFDSAVNSFSGMLSDAFTSNKTTVDEENNVIRSEGQEDIALVANQTSPARSEYLSYIEVTSYDLPGALGDLMGNGEYSRVFLHGDKMLTRDLSTGSLVDAGTASMMFIDYENSSYWTHSFADFGEMMDSAQRTQAEAMQADPGQSQDANVDVTVKMDIRQGESGVVRGSNSRQHFIIVETEMAGDQTQQQGGLQGGIFMVSEVWMTEDIAGRDTYREFGEQLAAAMGGAFDGTEAGQSLKSGMLADARVGAAMEKAAEELQDMQGLPVETRSYLVTVPEGQEFDLDLVTSDEEMDMAAWAASMSGEPVEGAEQKQVTIMSWKTFISNLSTDPFDPEVLDVSDLSPMASPLEQLGSTGGR